MVNYGGAYGGESWFRYYPNFNEEGIYRVTANRRSDGFSASEMRTQFITFSEGSGVRVKGMHYSFSGTETSTTVNLSEEFDVNRTVIWHADNSARMYPDYNGVGYENSGALAKAVLQDSTTVVLTRTAGGISMSSWGYLYLVELPMIPTHKISGVVTEKGKPVDRELRLHRTDTGELIDKTMSSGLDGYSFYTSYSGSTYVVCLDDLGGKTYNGLIQTDVYPAAISGTFPQVAGWV
jgi:hypothetical protein